MPVSNRGSNASVRVASNLFPARLSLADETSRARSIYFNANRVTLYLRVMRWAKAKAILLATNVRQNAIGHAIANSLAQIKGHPADGPTARRDMIPDMDAAIIRVMKICASNSVFLSIMSLPSVGMAT